MAKPTEGFSDLESQRMQFIGHLGVVAESMRKCATIAEQFAQMLAGTPAAPTKGKRKVQALEEDGPKKRVRRKKEPRDPLAPKRPASSYLLFQNAVRKELKAKNPDLPNAELLAIIGQKWAALPDDQKDKYNKAVLAAKEKYDKEKADYERNRAPDAVADVVAAAVEAHIEPPKKSKSVIKAPKSEAVVASTASETEDEEEDEEEDDESSKTDLGNPVPVKGQQVAAEESSEEDESEDESEEEVEQPPAKKSKGSNVPVPKKAKKGRV